MNSFIDPFCISAYVICKNLPDTPYLLIKRCSSYLPGTWQMVSGGIHENEKAWEAALREVYEETGLEATSIYSADMVETFYFSPKDKIAFVPVFVVFVDKPSPVILSTSEHDSSEWVALEEATKRLVWSEQRRVITHINEHFILKEPNSLLLLKS